MAGPRCTHVTEVLIRLVCQRIAGTHLLRAIANSLHHALNLSAQHCDESYIRSQRHEGWATSIAGRLQQIGQHQSLFGHRVLSCFRLKFGNSTLADLARWPPQRHRSPTLRIDPKTPPQAWTLTKAVVFDP
jgi:hypothetical protein